MIGVARDGCQARKPGAGNEKAARPSVRAALGAQAGIRRQPVQQTLNATSCMQRNQDGSRRVPPTGLRMVRGLVASMGNIIGLQYFTHIEMARNHHALDEFQLCRWLAARDFFTASL
jgi:hypothetical protein